MISVLSRLGRGQKESVEYLVKWKDWPSQYNEWYPVECLLENAKDLVAKYNAVFAFAAGLTNQARKRGRPRKQP